LRLALAALDDAAFRDQAAAFTADQEALQRRLQMLLMPQVPARRVQLFEDTLPSSPPIADLLATADAAMKRAAAAIAKGDRAAAAKDQETVETSFKELATVTKARILTLTQILRISRFSFAAEEWYSRFGRYTDRLNALLEETDIAAADNKPSNTLADRQTSLADTVQEQLDELNRQMEDSGNPSEHPLALPACLTEIVESLRTAATLIESKKLDDAIRHQERAKQNVARANAILADHTGRLGRYGGVLVTVEGVEYPSPFIGEIIEEQRDLLEQVRKAKEDELPAFAVSQKNLVHAVNATLASLAAVSDKVQSGTVMMFAKEDMQAAADALLAKDRVETEDAQDYIIETMEELREKIADLVAQHRYVLEISEATYAASQQGVLSQQAQLSLLAKAQSAPADAAALAREQAEIKAGFEAYQALIQRITGREIGADAATLIAEAETALTQNDIPAATAKIKSADAALTAASMAGSLKQIGLILSAESKRPEPALMEQIIVIATKQKSHLRETIAADGEALKATATALRDFAQALDPFITEAQEHQDPIAVKAAEASGEPLPPGNLHLPLVTAKQALADAATAATSGDRQLATSNQQKAADILRHFIIDYAFRFLAEPGTGAVPPPPAEAEIFTEQQDQFDLLMPGTVSGERPPDGKVDWEVLGRRQRAALNENFARELPLEHRDTLRNYFERLTE